jgi:23S rRNA (pseudouridine1915-N3)-methyltransferase
MSRLKNYVTFDVQTIHVPKNVRQRNHEEQKTAEGRMILEALQPGDTLILLDERGDEFSSQEFAKFISRKQNASTKRLVFVIGGPFGFDREVYAQATSKLSLSRMTFSHQMIRLFFAEQLYRAFTILKGEKYHHE